MESAKKLFSHLFPSRCLLCEQTIVSGSEGASVELCAHCLQRQPYNLACCVRCALPLADDAGSVLCGRCIKKTPAYDYVHSLFRYEDDVIRLVQQLKFSEKISIARSIGEMLLLKLDSDDLPDCLLPVPLHVSRMRQRGFNQSIEISRVLSKKYVLPIETQAVVRHRHTSAQSGLDAKQRRKNIRGAFQLVADIGYRHVLIVDDVMTTGSTVNELARLLKRSGVERVGVLCIARAPINS